VFVDLSLCIDLLHCLMDVMIISPGDRRWTYCAIFLFRETKPINLIHYCMF